MSIPASQLVSVTPSVLSAGGNPLALNGLILSVSSELPFGAPVSFPTAASVQNYFGPTSQEAAMAAVYFGGFDGSNIKPGALFFSRYSASALAAFTRGAAVTSLAAVQAITPAVSAATSTISGTTLTVVTMASGAYVPGMVLTGTGVTANTRIVSQLTGTTGGAGTYTVDTSQTVAATTITGNYDLEITVDGVLKTAASLDLHAATSFSNAAATITTDLGSGQTVTYDSLQGAFVVTSATTGASSSVSFGSGAGATALALTSATGAVQSLGTAGQTPATAMAAIIAQTQNWISFSTAFEPITADKEAFATWTNGTAGRYLYVPYDTDATATGNPTTFTGLGSWLKTNSMSGTCPVWSSYLDAAFVMGAFASVDYTQLNGRITLAFKMQSGLAATATDGTTAANLLANGYNFIGSYATANQIFVGLQNGQVSGSYLWADSYVDAIWLNNAFQLALMELLQNTKSVPYNSQGYGLIRAALQDPINQALNAGVIRAGATLSAAQAAEVNAAAGATIDTVLSTRGWYLQINPASAQQRSLRQSPPCTFWYTDGQSVQKINLASVNIQ